MFLLAVLLAVLPGMPALAGDPSIAEIISTTVEVPAHDYRAFSSRIANWPAVFHASFEVASGAPVQITLLARRDLNEFARGRHYEALVEMTPRRSGKFNQAVPEKGDYDILLVNDAEAPAMVRLQAAVQYAREPEVAITLSPVRKFVVISISLLVFGITFGWSGYKVIAGMRR